MTPRQMACLCGPGAPVVCIAGAIPGTVQQSPKITLRLQGIVDQRLQPAQRTQSIWKPALVDVGGSQGQGKATLGQSFGSVDKWSSYEVWSIVR